MSQHIRRSRQNPHLSRKSCEPPDPPELEALTLQWRREVEPGKRKEIAHQVQRLLARDMLWCNITDSPYFQAYRDYVKGYHFMNQVYVYWETTWLDKA